MQPAQSIFIPRRLSLQRTKLPLFKL